MFHSTRSTPSDICVAGVGHTSYGRHPGLEALDLGAQALTAALADCGLRHEDIDGLILNRIPDYQRFAVECGIDPSYVLCTPPHGRFSGICIQTAVAVIEAGLASTVALVYGNTGGSAGSRYATDAASYGSETSKLWFPYGMASPGAAHALMMQRHMHMYGSTASQLGRIARTFRHHASLNPNAVMRTPMSKADYLASPYVCEPLRRLDYCIVNDGGAAMVLTTRARAKDLARPVVRISGFGQSTALSKAGFAPDDLWHGPLSAASNASYRMAGAGPADIDGLAIYDNFTPTVLFALEGCGYCPIGEAGRWVEEGHLSMGARYPTNTSGGHLSESYVQGWNLNIEAVRQLRGQCDSRQIQHAKRMHYIAAAPVVTSIIYEADQ